MSAPAAIEKAPSPASAKSPFAWISAFVSSTIGAKYAIAVTGVGLVGFVVAHMLGNLQVFLGREMLNKYAEGMQNLGPLLWLARGGLLLLVVTHLGLALRLKQLSANARPVKYEYDNTIQASWASRHMVLTGLVILAFIVFHLLHFTAVGIVPARVTRSDGNVETVNLLHLKETYKAHGETKTRHDTYEMVIRGFRNPIVAIAYIIAQAILGLHMIHGTRSVFQTFGLHHTRWNELFTLASQAVSGIVVAGNILMPLTILCGVIGADVK
jgi:succinate dehydrogenase / fumarate reductase cytochrome b subunit